MACSYPITLVRNGRHELVPCGKCINCIQRKRGDWSFRLLQEQKNSLLSTFLTLTYNEKTIPDNHQLEKKALQRYFKRVRSENKKLKYYAVGEYGTDNGRPHYHAIVFNIPNQLLVDKWQNPVFRVNTNTGEITESGKQPIGFVTTDQVTEASIHYVTGYILSKDEKDEKTGKSITTKSKLGDTLRPFAIMSKGLGKIYLKHNEKLHKSQFKNDTTKEGGIKQILPRYYRNVMFPKDEIGIKLGLVPDHALTLNTLKNYLLDKYGEIDFKQEFEKRKYNKLMVKNQSKKKTL
jgi:hypothetical protein